MPSHRVHDSGRARRKITPIRGPATAMAALFLGACAGHYYGLSVGELKQEEMVGGVPEHLEVILYEHVPNGLVEEASMQALTRLGTPFVETHASEHDLRRLNDRRARNNFGFCPSEYWASSIGNSICALSCVNGLRAEGVSASAKVSSLAVFEADDFYPVSYEIRSSVAGVAQPAYDSSEWLRPCVCVVANSANQSLISFRYRKRGAISWTGAQVISSGGRSARFVYADTDEYIRKHRASYTEQRRTAPTETNQETADGWNQRGVRLHGEKLYIPAIGCFEEALRIDPDDSTAWGNLCTTLTLVPDAKLKEYHMEEALREAERCPGRVANNARIYLRTQTVDEGGITGTWKDNDSRSRKMHITSANGQISIHCSTRKRYKQGPGEPERLWERPWHSARELCRSWQRVGEALGAGK